MIKNGVVKFLLLGSFAVIPANSEAKVPVYFPENINLPESKQNGKGAINALGGRLPEVAAFYGKSTAEFARLIRQDKSLWIDKKGRVLYIDEFPTKFLEPEKLIQVAQAESFPLNQTFKLHSKPNSKRIIYLDFDGHTITGTAWNNTYGEPIIAQAYNIDSISGFSDTELSNIQEIWQRVAEDYAPFDVDVTTELIDEELIKRTDILDLYYGTRALITHNVFSNCVCGGEAYVNVFNSVGSSHDIYQPAIVYYNNLSGGEAKSVAEAITHEVGHNLNLNHDGTGSVAYYEGHGSGDTSWSPLMGVGYDTHLSQWSKGEYTGANNTEDDIQIIQNTGLDLRVDDHSNLFASASEIGGVINSGVLMLAGSGIIENKNDADYFMFEGSSGDILITIRPDAIGPNLDIKATLYDSNNIQIVTSNPVDSLSASISYSNNSPSTFYLKVEGTGKSSVSGTGYSDYGSLGQYSISGQSPTFVDTDNDGIDDTNDNCPNVVNTDQDDLNLDGVGNACSDIDTDTMTDAWEILYGLNPLDASDGVKDPDGDGKNNLTEFNTGLNPQVNEAAIAIQTIFPLLNKKSLVRPIYLIPISSISE